MRNLKKYPPTFAEAIALIDELQAKAERREKRLKRVGNMDATLLKFTRDRLVRLQFAASEEF